MKNKFIKVVAMIMFFVLTAICLSGCGCNSNELTKAQKQKLLNKYASIEIEYEGYKLLLEDDKRTSTGKVSLQPSIYDIVPFKYGDSSRISRDFGAINIRGITDKMEILKNNEYFISYNLWDNYIYKQYNTIGVYDNILKDSQKEYNFWAEIMGCCSFDGKLFIITGSGTLRIGDLIVLRNQSFVSLYYVPMLFVFDETTETFKYAGCLESILSNEDIEGNDCKFKIIKE